MISRLSDDYADKVEDANVLRFHVDYFKVGGASSSPAAHAREQGCSRHVAQHTHGRDIAGAGFKVGGASSSPAAHAREQGCSRHVAQHTQGRDIAGAGFKVGGASSSPAAHAREQDAPATLPNTPKAAPLSSRHRVRRRDLLPRAVAARPRQTPLSSSALS